MDMRKAWIKTMKMPSPSRKGLLALTALCTSVGSILVVFTLTWVMVTPDFLGADGPMGFPKEGRTALFSGSGSYSSGRRRGDDGHDASTASRDRFESASRDVRRRDRRLGIRLLGRRHFEPYRVFRVR